jgi:hypothetical protein
MVRNVESEKVKMPEETVVIPPQLNTGDDFHGAAALPPRVVGEGYLTCDFCECKLTKRGEVYQMSPKAKIMRDEKETNEKALAQRDEEITRLHAEITQKDAEISALRGSANTPARAKFI